MMTRMKRGRVEHIYTRRDTGSDWQQLRPSFPASAPLVQLQLDKNQSQARPLACTACCQLTLS